MSSRLSHLCSFELCSLERRWLSAAARILLAVLVILSSRPARAADPRPRPSSLVVFAAASLKDVFTRLATRFTAENPQVEVVVNAGGSQELRAQLEQGAIADVFATADEAQMAAIRAGGLVETPVIFACNEPTLVFRSGLETTLRTFADLPRAERIVVGAPQVPIGAYTQQILERAAALYGPPFRKAVEVRIASRELNVRQVLSKVVLGEADAAVVYRSDVASLGRQSQPRTPQQGASAFAGTTAALPGGPVRALAIPPQINVLATYPIAVVKNAPAPALARAWVRLVQSEAGRQALRDAGFSPCPGR